MTCQDSEYLLGWLTKTFPEEYGQAFQSALPKENTGYDFGGTEAPFCDGLTIVDISSPMDPFFTRQKGYPHVKEKEYIEGDLCEKLTLPPVQFINVSSLLSPLTFNDNWKDAITDNIDRALLPGGKVRLQDDYHLVRSIQQRLKEKGYGIVWEKTERLEKDPELICEDEDDEDEVYWDIIMQKESPSEKVRRVQ